MVPQDQILWTCLGSFQCCFCFEPAQKLGSRCSINLTSPIVPSYLRPIYTHTYLVRGRGGGGHRVHGYRITSIFRYLCRHSRHNDVAQAEHPSLFWILTTLKLTRFFAKEEALRHPPSEGEGRFRESVFRAQFRYKLNCPKEKSFFPIFCQRLVYR